MTVSERPLSEPWTFHFPYTRTTGPVVGRFLQGLRQRKILGLRTSDGGVLVPPHGHDPKTSEALTEWVELGTEGVLGAWTWIQEPQRLHPIQGRSFAFGLVRLDGATTGFLHAIDTGGDRSAVETGMRVRARWAAELRGHITDIACFEPATAPAAESATATAAESAPATEPARMTYDNPFSSDYEILAGAALSVHLRGLAEKKLIAMRGPSGNVFLPPTGADPITGDALTEPVELPDTGTITRYCLVNIPVRGQTIEVPFACADVLIDGADTTFMALIQGVPYSEVRAGMRVRAVWVADEELGTSMGNIKWFEPSGEPDADLSTLKGYL